MLIFEGTWLHFFKSDAFYVGFLWPKRAFKKNSGSRCCCKCMSIHPFAFNEHCDVLGVLHISKTCNWRIDCRHRSSLDISGGKKGLIYLSGLWGNQSLIPPTLLFLASICLVFGLSAKTWWGFFSPWSSCWAASAIRSSDVSLRREN